MEFIHAKNVFQKEVITFNRLWEEEEAHLIRREEERWKQLKIKLSKKIPQAMRNMKNSILKEPLIHIIIWIRNEEDDEAK